MSLFKYGNENSLNCLGLIIVVDDMGSDIVGAKPNLIKASAYLIHVSNDTSHSLWTASGFFMMSFVIFSMQIKKKAFVKGPTLPPAQETSGPSSSINIFAASK